MKQITLQRFLRSFIISTLLSLAVFFYIFYGEATTWPDAGKYWPGLVLCVLLANVLGLSLLILNDIYNNYFPWNRNLSLRFIVETGSAIAILAVLMVVYLMVYVKPMAVSNEELTFTEQYKGSIIKTGVFSVIILYIYSLVNFSVFSFNQYARVQIASIRSERDQLNLQFEALKSQLNPHFLFNALNTISSLIYKDIRLADRFIRQMAHTYNYILKTGETKLIDMNKELKMVESFFFMQKTRFGDSIHLSINIGENNRDSLIPPLTLQMLIENALKHNQVSDKKTLHITIDDEDKNCIKVQNNIIPKPELLKIGNNLIDRPKPANSHKIGLSNIRQRYGYFTQKQVEVKISEHFTVTLPAIIKNDEKTPVLQ